MIFNIKIEEKKHKTKTYYVSKLIQSPFKQKNRQLHCLTRSLLHKTASCKVKGEVTEWSKVPPWKGGVPPGT
jgi:hypothetical protein